MLGASYPQRVCVNFLVIGNDQSNTKKIMQ